MGVALTNSVATICFADGVANFYLNSFGVDDKTRAIVKEIKAAAVDILDHYDSNMNIKDYRAVYRRMKSMDEMLNVGKEIVYFTSFSISMVENMRSFLKDETRLKKINRLLAGLNALHEVVDDNDFKNYEKAAIAEDYWNRMVGR